MHRAAVLLLFATATQAQDSTDPFKLLRSRDDVVRMKAADAIAATATEKTILRMLKEEGQEEVYAPVFWRMGEKAEPTLLVHLGDQKYGMAVAHALISLRRMTAKKINMLLADVHNKRTRTRIVRLLAHVGLQVRPFIDEIDKERRAKFGKSLLDYLEIGDTTEMAAAIHAIAALGHPMGSDKKIYKVLEKYAERSHPKLQLYSTWALQSKLKSSRGTWAHVLSPKARRAFKKAKLVREPIRKGLAFLAKAQQDDGRWSGVRPEYDVGVTALVLQAFMGQGGVRTLDAKEDDPRLAVLRSGIAWLLSMQRTGDRFGPPTEKRRYNEALATYTLAEYYLLFGDPICVAPLRRAIKRLENANIRSAGWGYQTGDGAEINRSITAVVAIALKQAWRAGLDVDPKFLTTGIRFTKHLGNDFPEFPRERDSKFAPELTRSATASTLRTRMACGDWPYTSAMIRDGADLFLGCLPKWDLASGGIDMYYWWHASEALRGIGGSQQKAWTEAMVAVGRGSQTNDGSWPAAGAWGMYGGRNYATALMVLCLQAPYG